MCPNLIGYSLLVFVFELLYTPDRRRAAPRGRGWFWSSLHGTWYRSHNRSYDGTHEVSLAIGHVKTRLPALKILTEVHVPYESVSGPHQPPRTAKASGSVPDTPLTKGCQTWRWIGDQACCFLASLGFPFALRGYANEGTSYEAPRPVSAEVQMAQVWDLRLIRERWDLFIFKL
jgi:hypothetical protein